MQTIGKLCLGIVLGGLAAGTASAANVIETNATVTINRGHGVLRPGSTWTFEPSVLARVSDGDFAPEGQQWTFGSFWWDEDPTLDDTQMQIVFTLDQVYALDRFVVQADDNEEYVVDYWDGTAFVALEDIPGVGLQTRDSGIIAPIFTDTLRLSARGGDRYYAVSEFQAFVAVPEPATWAMMIAGFGLVGGAMRRRAAALATA